jgi:hypothetical protein
MIDLEDEFRLMLEAMGLEDISPVQRQGMRDAFYGGVERQAQRRERDDSARGAVGQSAGDFVRRVGMINLIDGPFVGNHSLCLDRLPIFLRFTKDANGKMDALNHLADKARPDETLACYRLVERTGGGFIDRRDPKSGKRTGGAFNMATYKHVPEMIDDAVMRDNDKWGEWCRKTYKAEQDAN